MISNDGAIDDSIEITKLQVCKKSHCWLFSTKCPSNRTNSLESMPNNFGYYLCSIFFWFVGRFLLFIAISKWNSCESGAVTGTNQATKDSIDKVYFAFASGEFRFSKENHWMLNIEEMASHNCGWSGWIRPQYQNKSFRFSTAKIGIHFKQCSRVW